MEFKVGNFLSFKTIEVLRMAPVLDSKKKGGTSFGEPSNLMFIYGANASGKSNLIKAMTFSRDIAVCGSSDINVSRYYKCRGPSYFEYVVKLNNTIYSYGFEIRLETMELYSEWLYILTPEEDVCLYEYERTTQSDIITTKNKLYCRTKMNSNRNNEHFDIIHNWLQNYVFIEGSRLRDEVIPVSEDIINLLSSNLDHMDTGITSVEEEPFINGDIPVNLIKKIPNKEIIQSDGDYIAIINGNNSKKSWLIHIIRKDGLNNYKNIKMNHGRINYSLLNDESLGTLRIIQITSLISMLKHNRDVSGLAIMDEIECSVHTVIVRKLVDFYKTTSCRFGQLITTTHKTNILEDINVNDNCFSFIDNDRYKNDGSRLYNLTAMDHKLKDRHRAYLDGRMAAIPYFTNDLE